MLCDYMSWASSCHGSRLLDNYIIANIFPISHPKHMWERSGSVVECLTQDQRAAGSSSPAPLHCGP